jgi:hypothetical protein
LVYPVLLAVGAGALVGSGISSFLNARQRRLVIHRAFLGFNERIKHEQFEERELLRERRELLTDRLRGALPAEHKARLFTQGSYAMQTGVKPLNGEYDIDVGLEFECCTKDFDGPVQAKMLVHDALRQGRRRVEVRRSCVTVYYKGASGLPDHHVDIAVYARDKDGRLMLAKGRQHSSPDECRWQPSHPEQLTALVRDRFEGEQVAQFRRCVRYLKRWKQVNFSASAPHSIALTMAAYHWFRPNADRWFEDLDDGAALLELVRTLLGGFQAGRLTVALPVAPEPDLLEVMTPNQMLDLRSKLDALEAALVRAQQQDISEAVPTLAGHFGDDFH